MSGPGSGPRHRSRVRPGSPFALLDAAIHDPTVTGSGRLPMRPALVPCPDEPTARQDRADASPWWRSLDGEWDVRFYDRLTEVPADIVGDRDGTWGTIQVPGAWSTQRGADGERFVAPHYTNVIMPFDEDPPEVPTVNPIGVHRRIQTVPKEWKGRRIVLRVGAAESVVAAYVNGAGVGLGTDSRLPNEFDITDHVTPGRRALIVLVVARWSAATWLEDQDQWWHGGIQRGVCWYSTAPSHLAQVTALPGLSTGADGRVAGTLDLAVVADGPVQRERGWTLEASVEPLRTRGRAGRRLATTGALELPVWNAASEGDQLLSGMFVEPGVVRTSLRVPDVDPWTHETPCRYRVLLTLRDPSGDVVEVTTLRTGFRDLEIGENELRINGVPVLLHGVNLHEHHPDRGRAVDEATTRHDLSMMKAHNLNAVRAAHYPHDEHLAELCDELGLYLVDEANVESHARQLSLCHDPRFAAAIVERVERMVLRDAHHPSIIMWSLGNESGYGPPHDAAAAWVRRVDPTRPLHYEGPVMHDLYADAPVTDVVCPMYAPIGDIVEWAESGRDPRRPLILCEYSHAMGNSNGSLSDYWDAFESHHGLQGGFIWEWLEHGLVRDGDVGRGPGGRVSWGYGGDFGDTPHDSNFICDGLVSAAREPHPAMREVHHVGRPAAVELAAGRGLRLHVRNRRWFTGLDDLVATWRLRVDGGVVDGGELSVPDIGPRGSAVVGVPLRLPRVPEGAEVHLDVQWSLRRSAPWAAAGHVVALDQVALDAPRRPRASVPPTRPPDERTWDVSQIEWAPTVFRALTDNDGLKQGWVRGFLGNLDRWITHQGLDRCEWTAAAERRRRVGDAAVLTTRGELHAPGVARAIDVRRRVEQRGDGWTRVTVTLRIPEELADVPRVGTEWVLPAALGEVEWMGDGPHECYPDRRAAATVGRHTSSVDQMYEDYVVPQEHGHRTGVRWIALSPRRGRRRDEGLLVVADPGRDGDTIGMAVRRHRDADLWATTHTDELARRVGGQDATYLYLDVAQRGLGTASCGPDALDRYRVGAGTHTLDVWFRGFDTRTEDPAALARSIRARR